MVDYAQYWDDEAERAKYLEIDRYLYSVRPVGTDLLNELRKNEQRGMKWVAVSDLNKQIIWPEKELKDILDGLMCRGLVCTTEKGGEFSLTIYGSALLLTFDRLNDEICKMLREEGVSAKEMARMTEAGFLHRVLARRALEKTNEE
jgi:hypothetical protein